MRVAEKAYELRSIEKRIYIAVPPDSVWKALTDADELVHWFPLEARVNPGPGGSIWLSWGAPVVAESRIEVWNPGRQLRTVEDRPLGVLLQPNEANGTSRTLDYELEPHDGGTEVRLIHSGFGAGSHWDEVYCAVGRGWEFQLRSLRHYLERHPGTQRSVARVRRVSQKAVENVWDTIMGSKGLLGAGSLAGSREGDHYSIRAVTGEMLSGIVQIYDPPMQFASTVANINDSFLRVKLVQSTPATVEAELWLGTYGVSETKVRAFEQRWQEPWTTPILD